MMSPGEKNETEPQDAGVLVRAAMGGDLQAFEKIVLQHQGAVRAYLAVRLVRADEAEDLAQEVFITAFRNLAKFAIGSSCRSNRHARCHWRLASRRRSSIP